MDPGSVEKAAAALLDAYATGAPIPPLTADRPDMSVADAYAVQLAQVEAWTGVGARIKGHNALVWLADVLGERGVTLEAGHVVLPGSITAAVPVAPGETFTAAFAGIASVTACFGKEAIS